MEIGVFELVLIVLGAVAQGAVLLYIGARFGAKTVFRTRHATTDIPFDRPKSSKENKKAYSYVSDLFPEIDDDYNENNENANFILDKTANLSEAATRLKSQKGSKADIMSKVRG